MLFTRRRGERVRGVGAARRPARQNPPTLEGCSSLIFASLRDTFFLCAPWARLEKLAGRPIYDISLALFRMPVTERQLRSRKREAGVDLNQLLYHHQMALMAAIRVRRDGDLLPGFDLPRYYEKAIATLRDCRGLGRKGGV